MSQNNTSKHENERSKRSYLQGENSSENTSFADGVDWYGEAHKLRQHNRELIKKIVQLEQNIKEDREALESQILRTRTGEVKISQQIEEVEANREQIEYLSREIEKFESLVQRKNILIETISKQLETSQEQIARVERECALIQEEKERQNQNFLETQRKVEELSARLHRQQRYTLEFKAALDQCLEVPAPNNSTLIPKVNAIEPWSAKGDREEIPSSEQTESIPIKKISLPNLKIKTNTERGEQTYSVESTSSLARDLDLSVTKSRKKSQSKTAIDLPKLPRNRCF